MRLAFLLAVLFQADRAERLFEQVKFETPEPAGDEERRVIEVLTNKERWVGAFREIEEKLGPFPDGLAVQVSFDYAGEEFAQGAGAGREGRVRFNLKKLAEFRGKLDEVEKRKQDLAKEGKKLVFRVPPARLDRIIVHELTHVLQRQFDAPTWFNEGMAQWVADDPNCVCAFAAAGKTVASVETPLAEIQDTYARGHLFWKWLGARGAARKAVQAALFERRPWKKALEDATDLPWDSLTAAEQEWSAKELEKFKAKPK